MLNAFHCTSEHQTGCILLQICLLYCVHPLHTCLLLVVRCVLPGSTHCMYSSNFSGQHAVQAALHPTEAQQTDIMFLRQVYYGSVGNLAHERKQLLQQLPSGAAESAAQVATRLTNIRVTAQRLQDHCHAQFQMYTQLPSVYRQGVSTGKHLCFSVTSHREASAPHPLRLGLC